MPLSRISRTSVSISYSDGTIRRLNSCNATLQLRYINCIGIVSTISNISDCLITSINTSLSYGWATSDSQTVTIYFGTANCQGTILSKIDILSQLNFQLAIVSINTNVVISQSACCTTDDIHNIVEVFLDNVRVSILVSLTIIASKLHAVVVSCHFVILTVFIFVNDTSH